MTRIVWVFQMVLLLALLAGAGRTDGLPLLHTQGAQIVDARGNVVILRGVNLGGWLVEEPWMQPFVTTPPPGTDFGPIKDHVSLWGTVEKRFGAAGMARVRTAFREAWVNEADFARIHEAGLNCVRLPFLASLADEPDGLVWLDRAVAWAGRHGIYVILDLHGAPGGQSGEPHTGQARQNRFFKDPANVAAAEALWTRIARRYRDNPAVAGYDLINEPTGTPGSDTLYVVMDRLYRAVRAGDPSHLIFIEDGYTGLQWMPHPAPCGWRNVVYSGHYYQFQAESEADQRKGVDGYLAQIEKLRQSHSVPFYLGEFGLEPHGTPATVAYLVDALGQKGIAWSLWTYKVIFRGNGGRSLWGLIYNAKPVAPLDPYRDSEADLIRKCAQLRSENLAEYAAVAQAFQDAAQAGRRP
ncbi:MAG: cellulase family glycosylhydrolase [Armatimonadetes bacterium]|nr:cellulase family glycosylhydrolase [Armatimonadota bacterium]